MTEQPSGEPPRARRARRDPWKTAFVLLAVAGIVVGVAWALLGARFLVVRSVSVTGLHRVSRPQVLAAAGVPMGMPLIRVDTAAIGRRVDGITQVRSAQVSVRWPDCLLIQVTERTPALAVRRDGGYDLIDGSGVVVTSVARKPARIPLLRPSSPIRGSPAVAAAAAVVHELPVWLSRRLASVTAPDPGDVRLRLIGGVTVVWGSARRGAAKTRVLAALMRTHAQFYDVSSPAVASTR